MLKNMAQFVQIISCNLPVMEITHKNALLTSGSVKRAHLKIRDGFFVSESSFGSKTAFYAKSVFIFFETFRDERCGFFNRLVGNVDDRAAELFVKIRGKIELGLNIVHIGIIRIRIQAVRNHALSSDVVQN